MARVLCFDIDGTLTENSDTDHEDLSGTYIARRPNAKVRKLVHRAYQTGWTIIFYTGRRESQRRITEDWLQANGFHWHFCFFDKAYYTFIVDDRARSVDEIEKIIEKEEV